MIREEYGKEYKDAVEQIQLSDSDKEELLEAVLRQKTVVRKRKKLPYYAGGVVAAAAVMLLVVGGNNMLFSQNDMKADIGMTNGKKATNNMTTSMDMEDYDSMESAKAEESDGMESPMEEEGYYETSDSEYLDITVKSEESCLESKAEIFQVVAYTAGIERADEDKSSLAQNESSKETAGNKYSGVKGEKENADGMLLESGKSYNAYSQEVPSCTIALLENDNYACDSYRIRLAGSVAKTITEEGKEGEAASDLWVKSGEKVCIQVEKDAAEKGCTGLNGMEADVWEDKDMLTVAQVMIEAVKDDEIIGVRKIYIGRKGEWYYGLVQ